MEQQKSSRDSLQYSSGYSTETTTPSCSEDTIPSQGETSRPDLLEYVASLFLQKCGKDTSVTMAILVYEVLCVKNAFSFLKRFGFGN